MRRKSSILYMVLILVIFSSACREEKPIQEPDSEIESGLYETIAFDPQPSFDRTEISYNLEDVEFIRLDNKDALVDLISNIVVNDSLIYVIEDYDNLSINIFNKKGDLIKKFNKLGKGPDEYVSVTDVRIDRTTGNIEVLANFGRKLLRYDPDGRFIDYKRLPCSGLFNFYHFGEYYYFYKTLQICDEELKTGNGFRLIRTKAESPDKIDQTYLPFHFKGRKVPKAIMNFINIIDLPNIKDTLVLFDEITDTVYNISHEDVHPRYILRFKGEGNKKSVILKDPSIINKSEAIRKAGLSYLLDWRENDKYVVMEYSYSSAESKQRYVNRALYDKDAKQIFPFQRVLLDGIPFDIGILSLYITNSGKFICLLQPVELLRRLDAEKKNKTSDGSISKLIERYKLEDVTENDNPILIEFNLSRNEG